MAEYAKEEEEESVRRWFEIWGLMGSDGGHFRVTLSMRREPNAGPVYCKMETSARFRQLKTVKLSAEATYRLDISFKPPQVLQCVYTYMWLSLSVYVCVLSRSLVRARLFFLSFLFVREVSW